MNSPSQTLKPVFFAAFFAFGLICLPKAEAIIGFTSEPPDVNVNAFVGAEFLYNLGYTGTNTIVANIEAGHAWNGHETLSHLSTFIEYEIPEGEEGDFPQLGEFDRHATWASHAIAGRTGNTTLQQRGIAYNTTLWSGAIASEWTPNPEGTPRYTLGFSISNSAFHYTYSQAIAAGIGGEFADVVNSSWGAADPAAESGQSLIVNQLAYENPGSMLVFSAGNSGDDPNTVGGPASASNTLAVGAASSADSDFDQVASFSSRGPNEFATGTRAIVDILAPGTDLVLAQYNGETGGNSPLLGGDPDPASDLSDGLYDAVGGTSFSAPIVSGGIALLKEATRAELPSTAEALDSRVVKAVLLNSATKIAGWDNNTIDSGGVLTTTQALDYAAGAGMMNLEQAYYQMTSGDTNLSTTGGFIQNTGWDFGTVGLGGSVDYIFSSLLDAGDTITATLSWFELIDLEWNEGFSEFLVSEYAFIDLNLELWQVVDNSFETLIAQSITEWGVTEHFNISLPEAGGFGLRVTHAGVLDEINWSGDLTEFGLAWEVTPIPEPARIAFFLALLMTGWVVWKRRHS